MELVFLFLLEHRMMVEALKDFKTVVISVKLWTANTALGKWNPAPTLKGKENAEQTYA